MRDWHILTNGARTYTSDSRFTVLHKEGTFDWVLQVRYLQERDAGLYECQVSMRHLQRSAKVDAPGCVHAAGKLGQR